MGNFNVLNCIKDPPVVAKDRTKMTVATLNYCGILSSPFEFYTKEYAKQFKQISNIFRSLIPKYAPNFDENFKWEMGKIDKKVRKGRYSNMFDPSAGTYQNRLMNRQQFEVKWNTEFKNYASRLKQEFKEDQIANAKLFDFIMYHTMLQFVFETESFEDAIKNKASIFRAKIEPFYHLTFLDQHEKLKKFKQGFSKLYPDVFFIQQYSKLLLEELKKSNFHVITDRKQDSLILLNKNSFNEIFTYKEVVDQIEEQQKKEQLSWGEGVAFTGADNYIFICIHLSSKQNVNPGQILKLKRDLLLLKQHLPKYNIVVGGDLNSFLPPDKDFCTPYRMFPTYEWQFTTLKKRTYAQAQFHKAEKEIKESKDRIITTSNIERGQVMYLGGGKADESSYLPSNEHPYDHLLCYITITRE